jgi:hypothetical protein
VGRYLDTVVDAEVRELLQAPVLSDPFDIETFVSKILDRAGNDGDHPVIAKVAKQRKTELVKATETRYSAELLKRSQEGDQLYPVGDQRGTYVLFTREKLPPAPEWLRSAETSQPQAEQAEVESTLSPPEQSEPEETPQAEKPGVLPALSREALQRIANAEREAREQYDRDKLPYFPKSPEFSFLEDSIFRSMEHILEYVRIFAEHVLDARLKEYYDAAPADLLTNKELLVSVARHFYWLTNELWGGYGLILQGEPTERRAKYRMAIATGTIDQHPELEPWRYPDKEGWAQFLRKNSEENSEMAKLNARYDATMEKVLADRIRHYQRAAVSRLTAESPVGQQPAETQSGEPGMRPAESNLAESTSAPGTDIRSTIGSDRRAAVDAYIAEVLAKTGRRITRTHIWRAAGYKSRTEFERWERDDPDRRNHAANEAFNRILSEKPHLKPEKPDQK